MTALVIGLGACIGGLVLLETARAAPTGAPVTEKIADKGTAADGGDKPLTAPTISAVLPATGGVDDAGLVTIIGSGFGTKENAVTVTYGPNGAADNKCITDGGLTLYSDGLLTCRIPDPEVLAARQPVKFIVTVTEWADAGGVKDWKSSDVSAGAYAPLPAARSTSVRVVGGDRVVSGERTPALQVHVEGESFSTGGGAADGGPEQPIVTLVCGKELPASCTDVFLIDSRNLVCALPRSAELELHFIPTRAGDLLLDSSACKVEVIRGGERP